MAEQLQLTLDGTAPAPVAKRKSDTREEKLKVVKFYFDNGKDLYQTSKKLSLNTKNILRWIRAEEQIRDSSKGRRRGEFQRTALHPEMKKLHSEYRELRKKGLKVKGWWFLTRAKQILSEMQPDALPFGNSDGWFMRFKARHRISKRRATNSCQKEPDDK